MVPRNRTGGGAVKSFKPDIGPGPENGRKKRGSAMPKKSKITTGPNDRPSDETISQTGGGLPDDSARSPQTTESEVERTRKALEGDQSSRNETDTGTPEAVPPGTAGAGENICRRCAGTGEMDGETCPDCEGTGKVITPTGGG